MQDVVCDCCAAQERSEETNEPNGSCFLPLCSEDYWIELSANEESQDNRTCARQKSDPLRLRGQTHGTDDGPDRLAQLKRRTSCATVPTTISDKAVEILNQIARSVAISANPTQMEASAQTFCMSAPVFGPGILAGGMTPRQDSLSRVISVPA